MKQYILKHSFISRNGNSFQARKEPYFERELPDYILTNPDFCSPVEEIEVVEEILTKDATEDLTPRESISKPIVHKAKQVKTSYVPKAVKTEEIEVKEEPTIITKE